MSPEPELTLAELEENFELLGDWEQRFHYILDLGKKLPPLPPEVMTDDNLVKGCQASVWLIHRLSDDAPPRLHIQADSDAFMVKGLIAILQIIVNGKSVDEILDLDIESIFTRLGLEQHLSPTRRNGLHAMVKLVRETATRAKA